MSYLLTVVMCAYIEGKTTCMPPFRFEQSYVDAYSCMLDGYSKSYDKLIELGREDVNKFNIYIKMEGSETSELWKAFFELTGVEYNLDYQEEYEVN